MDQSGRANDPLPPKPRGQDEVTEQELRKAGHVLSTTKSHKAVSKKAGRKKVLIALAESLAPRYPSLNGQNFRAMTKDVISEMLTTAVSIQSFSFGNERFSNGELITFYRGTLRLSNRLTWYPLWKARRPEAPLSLRIRRINTRHPRKISLVALS